MNDHKYQSVCDSTRSYGDQTDGCNYFQFNKQILFICRSFAGECMLTCRFAVKLNVIRAHFESLWLLAMQLLPYN
jgi:hypothetical protein